MAPPGGLTPAVAHSRRSRASTKGWFNRRPGEKWDKRGERATSEEIAAAWREEIHFAIDAFGPSRCLFESNFPVDKACYGYVEIWNAFKRLTVGCSADEKGDLFHDTAARAYRLPLLAG